MFFILSKTVYFFLMPLGWIFILLFAIWRCRTDLWKRRLKTVLILLVIFLTNPYLANLAMHAWEYRPVPFSNMHHYHTAIVLTGVAKSNIKPRDRIYYNKGADRVIHTYMLFKKGLVDQILISGGSGALIPSDISEAENIKRGFIEMGVPDSSLIIEDQSKNTWESARNIKEKYSRYLSDSSVLITSAFHMKRASRCFKKAGIPVKLFPADFHSDRIELTPESLIPSVYAMDKWHIIFHEWLGIVAYTLAGFN